MKKPVTIHAMAWRRGLSINKARRGGWYVSLMGSGILYCTHQWSRVEHFIKQYPVLIKRRECG